MQAVRPIPFGDDFADGILERGDVAHAVRHVADARRRQLQAVHRRGAEARLLAILHVDGVGVEDPALMRDDAVGHGEKRGALAFRRGERERPGGGAGLPADLVHQRDRIGRGVFVGLKHGRLEA